MDPRLQVLQLEALQIALESQAAPQAQPQGATRFTPRPEAIFVDEHALLFSWPASLAPLSHPSERKGFMVWPYPRGPRSRPSSLAC